MLLAASSGDEGIRLTSTERDGHKGLSNHPLILFKGPAPSKCFLWSLSQMDMWNKNPWIYSFRVQFPTRPMLHVLLGFLSPFKLSKPKIYIVLPCLTLNNSDWLLSLWLLCQDNYYAHPRVNIATSTLKANGLLALSNPEKQPLPLSISAVNSGFRRHNEASGHKLSAMSSLFYPHKTERERERPLSLSPPFPRAEPISGTKGPPGQSRPETEEWLEF